MKFNDKFPDKVHPQKVYPERLMGPHPEIEVEPGLIQSWRIYPCTCGTPTGWRNVLADDFPPTPCCSEECQAQQRQNLVECESCLPTKERRVEDAELPGGTSKPETVGAVSVDVTPPGLKPTPTKFEPRIDTGTVEVLVVPKAESDEVGFLASQIEQKPP
jgi:hypothetical protein